MNWSLMMPGLYSRRAFLRLGALACVSRVALASTREPFGSAPVHCTGTYPGHLQGVCADEHDQIFWSFTTTLVKTDGNGAVQRQISVPTHHGAPCYLRGRVYVPVNLTVFNDAARAADSWIYVYGGADLSLLARHPVPEVIYGAGGMACDGEGFLVVGGLPEGMSANLLYRYSADFKLLRTITLQSGYTRKGIQTVAFADGHWWFGCYGTPEVLLKVDPDFNVVQRLLFDCATGILPVAGGFLVSQGGDVCTVGVGCSGTLVPAIVDRRAGLVLQGGAKKF